MPRRPGGVAQAQTDEGRRGVVGADRPTVHHQVAFLAAEGAGRRFDFRAGESGCVVIRGRRFLSGELEIFRPFLPVDWKRHLPRDPAIHGPGPVITDGRHETLRVRPRPTLSRAVWSVPLVTDGSRHLGTQPPCRAMPGVQEHHCQVAGAVVP